MKNCTNKNCQQINPQPFENFCKNRDSKDGLNYNCRSCCKKSFTLFVNKDPEKERARHMIANRTSIRRFQSGIGGAKRRNYDWDLTFEQWETIIQDDKCHYCDDPLDETGCGVDRKDNTLGYTLHNSIACCGRCNRIKGDNLTYDEMVIAMAAVKGYRNLQKIS